MNMKPHVWVIECKLTSNSRRGWVPIFVTDPDNPRILRTRREARAVAKKLYKTNPYNGPYFSDQILDSYRPNQPAVYYRAVPYFPR